MRTVETGECGCKRVIFTNKKRPGIATVVGYPCKTHGQLSEVGDLRDLINLPTTASKSP
jgi:hypothetical protein